MTGSLYETLFNVQCLEVSSIQTCYHWRLFMYDDRKWWPIHYASIGYFRPQNGLLSQFLCAKEENLCLPSLDASHLFSIIKKDISNPHPCRSLSMNIDPCAQLKLLIFKHASVAPLNIRLLVIFHPGQDLPTFRVGYKRVKCVFRCFMDICPSIPP